MGASGMAGSIGREDGLVVVDCETVVGVTTADEGVVGCVESTSEEGCDVRGVSDSEMGAGAGVLDVVAGSSRTG